tara:strand:+ start:207 stop:542 length:336 start_codon:yes stop_codon:yes gene_type:complete
MIKLKNILNEKANKELGKVVTAKDEPSFMTEEQWAKKWNEGNVNEDKEILVERPIWMQIAMVSKFLFVAIVYFLDKNPNLRKRFFRFIKDLDNKLAKYQGKETDFHKKMRK